MRYDHKKIESKWQREWEKQKLYKVSDEVKGKKNFYALVEFPYPSGNLHVGHWYAFSVPDIFARFKRMQGKNVLFPIGFDAFGLPAENAALERGLNPRKWTEGNIAYMRKQLHTMGASFDWSREVVTSDPEYYKWTQWMFQQFFKKGLAYQAETNVNWCPKDKTVLANEQVINGRCDRCGSIVEQRKMKQWLLKITDYAEKLLAGLDKLDWPEEIKQAQRNWIGRSDGAEISFQLVASQTDADITRTDAEKGRHKSASSQRLSATVKVFTTRPDTIFGATYMVLAPEHPLVASLLTTPSFNSSPLVGEERRGGIQNRKEVEKYIQEAKRKTELQRLEQGKEKTGIELKGIRAINPATKDEIPIWIADYVLATYGTGAIMAVPAHDERDFEFAKKYNLPVRQVIYDPHLPPPHEGEKEGVVEAYVDEGKLINSGKYNGLASQDARRKITGDIGQAKIQYKIRDWVISRQRYWGAPIPVTHCKDCGVQPVPEKDLPVKLPEIKDYKPRGDGKSPLAKVEKWVKVKCPNCGKEAERETDTMDTFVDSSWYFLRYTDPKNKKKFADEAKMKAWMPVNRYSGGAEHTTMHLLYSRFWIKAMYDLGLVEWDEPYVKRMNRGIILGPDSRKMSKRWGNVVAPDKYVKELGTDTVRMYLAFIGPYNEVGAYPWDPKGIMGVRRFLEKIWRLFHNSSQPPLTLRGGVPPLKVRGGEGELLRLLHKTIKKVTEDIENFKFNTAVSALMIFLNSAQDTVLSKQQLEIFLKLLATFAPHLAEELWHQLKRGRTQTGTRTNAEKDQRQSASSQRRSASVHEQRWPEYDAKLVEEDIVSLPVQINGKHRATIQIAKNATQEEAEKAAKQKADDYLKGKSVRKVVFVQGKIINFVIN